MTTPAARVLVTATAVAAVVVLVIAWAVGADSGTTPGADTAQAAPKADEQASYAGLVSLVALAGVVLFGLRRVVRRRD